MRKTRRLVAVGAIVLGAVGLALLFGDGLGRLTGVQAFEDYTLDLRQQTTPESFQEGRGERESEIVLVLFDQLSFEETPWLSPFPRSHLAELVDAVAGAGATTIGIDVYLDELFPALNEIDSGDDRLRDAIDRAGNVILVSPVVDTDSGPVVASPHPYFTEVALDVGTAELPASFETFRVGTLAVHSGDGLEPSFALAMYAHSRGLDVDSLLAAAWQSGRIGLPGLPEGFGEVPQGWRDGTDEGGRGAVVPFRILFSGPPSGTLTTDPVGSFVAQGSATAVDYALFAPEAFRDKTVILGTGFHAEDRFRTPFYADTGVRDDGTEAEYTWMYGAEIHANALQNMIDGRYVRPMGTGAKLAWMTLLASLVGGVVFWWGTALGALGAAFAISLAWVVPFWAWAGSVYLMPSVELGSFSGVGAWVPIGTPALGALFTYVGSVAYVAIIEGREKRFIKGAFGKYLSPDVVAEISEDPSALTLGGEKRPLSLLFSDLSGFTELSEEMDAQDLITLLNEYLNVMTQVVFHEGGYLDKYIGDAIMAFWNAPKTVPDHPDRAMRTAILMQRRMRALNERWSAGGGREDLQVRIGVHTGEVVVGNVGGEDRFDYSAIGDAVNLAARLEPANKTYGTRNMVSEATLALASETYRVRELDTIAVKGKDEPVKVFELLEMEGVELDPAKERMLPIYEEGMALYKEHDWAEAKRRFEAAVEVCPEDGPSLLYVERCAENLAAPPPPDWDFVVRRTEK
ncbi:MAG: CHASE2 domain-containing protein [Gemmatimonadetes bacterium]|nr:CHASE2 domain-containing protein [Gemmatimonadota bacterium]